MHNTTDRLKNGSGTLTHRVVFTLRPDSSPLYAADLDQAGSRHGLQVVPVRQSFFQMPSCDPNMFTSETLRARSLPVLDSIDDGPMMLFRDGASFLPLSYGLAQDDGSARRHKREPVNLINGAPQGLVFSDAKDS